MQGRAGEGVEDPPAVAAAVIEDRSAMRAMDPEPIAAASRAGQALGVEDHDEAGVAGILVHQAGQREVHRRPLSACVTSRGDHNTLADRTQSRPPIREHEPLKLYDAAVYG